MPRNELTQRTVNALETMLDSEEYCWLAMSQTQLLVWGRRWGLQTLSNGRDEALEFAQTLRRLNASCPG